MPCFIYREGREAVPIAITAKKILIIRWEINPPPSKEKEEKAIFHQKKRNSIFPSKWRKKRVL